MKDLHQMITYVIITILLIAIKYGHKFDWNDGAIESLINNNKAQIEQISIKMDSLNIQMEMFNELKQVMNICGLELKDEKK